MTEATTATAGLTAVASGTTGTVAITWLAVVGLDVPSLAAALLGCVIVQTLLPAEDLRIKAIALMTLGSMLFASMATPFVAPYLAAVAPAGISHDHIKATSAALLAAFPKPALIFLRGRVLKFLGQSNGAA